jgi:hypothetical protein
VGLSFVLQNSAHASYASASFDWCSQPSYSGDAVFAQESAPRFTRESHVRARLGGMGEVYRARDLQRCLSFHLEPSVGGHCADVTFDLANVFVNLQRHPDPEQST